MRNGVSKCVWAIGLAVIALVSLDAQTDRKAIERQQIADAMTSYGLNVPVANIELLSHVTAAAGASLRVTGESAGPGDARIVRLRCASQSQCIPFYVLAHSVKASARVTRNIVGTAPRRSPVVVHRGHPVCLVIESTGFQIQLTAVPLDDGRAGDVIRLQSYDRKRTYSGQVVNENLVRGTI